MKILSNRRRGFVAMVWAVIILFLIFIIVIGGIVFTLVRTIKKICPPPPPDENGIIHMPAIGDKYQGGTVTGYAPPPQGLAPESEVPEGFTVHWVYIFADNSPRPAAWTNCIWNGSLLDLTNQIGSNGLPMENWPQGQMPTQRFYQIVVSNGF